MASLGGFAATIDYLLTCHGQVRFWVVFPYVLLDQFKLYVDDLNKPVEDQMVVEVELGVQVMLLLDIVEFLSSILQVSQFSLQTLVGILDDLVD